MIKLDVTVEEIKSIAMIHMALDKAIFPMIEGSEITNLATSKARLASLRFKLEKYLKQLDEDTAKQIEKKATPKVSKDPIKKDK